MYTVNLTERELTEVIRALASRGDVKTNYGKYENESGKICYDLEEKLRNMRMMQKILLDRKIKQGF